MLKKSSIIPLLVIFFIVVVGFVQINIINTKALSPIGNTKDNYEMVSKEFGKDFTEFIKDNSPVKIYNEEEETTVSVMGQEYVITKNNPILQFIDKTGSTVSSGFGYVKTKVDNLINNINTKSSNENNAPEEKTNNELDSIIDGYIQNNSDTDVNSNNKDEDSVDVTNQGNNQRNTNKD